MIQSFQCPVCGTLNALGEPECTDCGQGFVYNCPVCGTSLNNRNATCPNCRTVFNWAVARTQNPPAVESRLPESGGIRQEPLQEQGAVRQRGAKGPPITSRPMFWAILIVTCAILIALLLIVDGLLHA